MTARLQTATEHELAEAFGARLRQLRRARGISTTRAAAAHGVSRSALTSWEKGERTMRASRIDVWCDLLCVEPWVLLDGLG